MIQPVLPGQTIGILGGGQLGRMLAMAARRQGYRVHVLTPHRDSPASHFASEVTLADDHDQAAWNRFADSVDVVTLEFENLPPVPLEQISHRVPVRPGLNVLRTCQNRAAEKAFLQEAGIDHARFAIIEKPSDLQSAWQGVGGTAVLKTSGGGYDGKGQAVVADADSLEKEWRGMGQPPCTLELRIDLDCEFSVIVARDLTGGTATYGPIRNLHSRHILDLSSCPAGLPAGVESRARRMADRIADRLQLVGLVCVEFFLSRSGEVLVNEIAPRPHNSGHLTIEAFACSQFEQQLRCVVGLPVAPAVQIRPAAMVNLLGDLWRGGEPDWKSLAAVPDCHLHLYGKSEPRCGRKMGHLTVCAGSVEAAVESALGARAGLVRPAEGSGSDAGELRSSGQTSASSPSSA